VVKPLPFIYDGDKAGEVCDVLSCLTGSFSKRIGSNLKGLYLHGSLAMGCFRPWSSDIDLLAVVFKLMDRETKLALVGDAMAIAEGGPEFRKFEFSVVTAEEAACAVHPIKYILHYSNTWHQAYKEGNAELVITGGEDEDLAAHFMVIRQRGVTLCGASVAETIGQVSRKDYLKAVFYDINHAETEILRTPMYTVLSLCRTLMYLKTDTVGSKREGGRWAVSQLELCRWNQEINAALNEYESGLTGSYNDKALCDLARFMLGEIQQLSGVAAQYQL
jgi:predicted nucleotidyltransferase